MIRGIASNKGKFPKLLKILKVGDVGLEPSERGALRPRQVRFRGPQRPSDWTVWAMSCDRWVQDWVQVAGCSRTLQSRKSRRVNDSVDGYEPGGRRFESCWARQCLHCQ